MSDTVDKKEPPKLPLDEVESAKLALAESAKKVADLKTRFWEISKNAVIVLAFLAAVFHGDIKYASLPISNCAKFAILGFYVVYMVAIYWQAFSNQNTYKTIYRTAAKKLFSPAAQSEYFGNDEKTAEERMIEDEGRLQWFLIFVVAAFVTLVVVQILQSPKPMMVTDAGFSRKMSARIVLPADLPLTGKHHDAS